jgi:hypothetical protein
MKRAKESMANIRLLFRKREEVWMNYLRFKRDWEVVMEKIHKEGMDGLLENCWI